MVSPRFVLTVLVQSPCPNLYNIFVSYLFDLVGSDEEKNWRRRNPGGYKLHTSVNAGATDIHKAASHADTETVNRLLKDKPELANHRDVNGWMPIHVSN